MFNAYHIVFKQIVGLYFVLQELHGGYAAAGICEIENQAYIALTKRRRRNGVRRRPEMVSPTIPGIALDARCPPTPGVIFCAKPDPC